MHCLLLQRPVRYQAVAFTTWKDMLLRETDLSLVRRGTEDGKANMGRSRASPHSRIFLAD